jgi:hypothetical protein
MRSSMRVRRPHAAGDGLPAPTTVRSQFRFRPSMNEQAVRMPWHRLFRHRIYLVLAARRAWTQFPNRRWDSEGVCARLLDNGLRECRRCHRRCQKCGSPKQCQSGHRQSPIVRARISASDSQTLVPILVFPDSRIETSRVHHEKASFEACIGMSA